MPLCYVGLTLKLFIINADIIYVVFSLWAVMYFIRKKWLNFRKLRATALEWVKSIPIYCLCVGFVEILALTLFNEFSKV